MSDFKFEPLDNVAAQKILQGEFANPVDWPYMVTDPGTREIRNVMINTKLPLDKIQVAAASLPFYDEFKLYSLTDTSTDKTRYMLYKPGHASLMNWTNEPIYAVNEVAPIKLERKTCVPYAKFFFHYVRGQQGRFIIVEKPEEVKWLPNATAEEKAKVAEQIKPVVYKGIGRDNLFTLTAIVVFKNALFKTDIKIAPYELDAFDPEQNAPEHFTIGQMKLTNEDLLLEDLNVPIDPPAGEFG